jgi:phosphoribosylformylglycinamidine synthase
VPQYRWPIEQPSQHEQRLNYPVDSIPEPADLSALWINMLGTPNVCSRFPIYRQYDSTVRTNTVVHPGGDAAVIRVKRPEGGAEKGIAITLDCNSRYCSIDPRQGTALSLAEAIRNITAVGAHPIGISDCLNFGSPQRPEGMWQIAESIKGLGEAARAFGVPVVSGNVSLYNETKGKAVLPTPMLAVVGLIGDVSKCVTAHFQKAGDRILLVGATNEKELGGSEYLVFLAGVEKGVLPELYYDLEIRTADAVRDLIDRRLLNSCHDLSSGGLAVALSESCITPYSALGAALQVESYEGRGDSLLFAESGARYLISCEPAKEDEIRNTLQAHNLQVTLSGTVGGNCIEIGDVARINLEKACDTWRNGLTSLVSV